MGGATKTSTRLVNDTDKVIHFFVESSGENYFFKKTLKPKSGSTQDSFTEEFDPNSTYRKMRMFEGHSNSLTDISISTDDMIDSHEIAVTEVDGRFVLQFTARSGETSSRAAQEGEVTWTQSFINNFYWLKGPSYPMPK